MASRWHPITPFSHACHDNTLITDTLLLGTIAYSLSFERFMLEALDIIEFQSYPTIFHNEIQLLMDNYKYAYSDMEYILPVLCSFGIFFRMIAFLALIFVDRKQQVWDNTDFVSLYKPEWGLLCFDVFSLLIRWQNRVYQGNGNEVPLFSQQKTYFLQRVSCSPSLFHATQLPYKTKNDNYVMKCFSTLIFLKTSITTILQIT